MGIEKVNKNNTKNKFYKTNPSGGISLIVLVITIIVVIILAAAVIISLQNNNPMIEANKARINSDVANMQAIFTNTVGKIMAVNQDTIQVDPKQLNTVTSGDNKAIGQASYKIMGADGNPIVEGKIIFSAGTNLGTTYYTGKELPIYSSETIWYVDENGMITVNVGGVPYGEGEKVEEKGEEIAESENPMLQYWVDGATTDFHSSEYREKITKVRFATNVKVPESKIESWDVSKDKDGSVMAWVQDDGNEGYILTIAGKSQIIAYSIYSYFLDNFQAIKEIENIEKVKDLKYLHFNGCSSLTSLDLSKIDMSKVTSLNFSGCSSLENIDFGNLEGCKVTNLVFSGCSSLTSLDLRGIDTSQMTSMSNTFENCSKLESLDISTFNTSQVTGMSRTFSGCRSLTSLDISSFDTSNVNNMQHTFENCYKLENVDFSNWVFSGCPNCEFTFMGCSSLNTTFIINSELGIKNSMFKGVATNSSAQVILNYTEGCESIVDNIITSAKFYNNSNIIKGVQVD